MKVLKIIILIFMVQCSYESDHKNKLSFDDWRKSVIEAVTNTNLIKDHQKEVMLILVEEISKEGFDMLTSRLTENDRSDYHLILYYSEGEVVSTLFGGIVTGNDSMNFAFLDGEDNYKEIIAKKLSDKRINELLDKEEMDHMILDPIIVISWLSEQGIVLSQVKTIERHL